jgi:hypothetical protein
MKFIDFMKAVDYMVVEGNLAELDCYPKDTRVIDAETKAGFAWAYFDPKTLEIYEVFVSDKLSRQHQYRWLQPGIKEARYEYNKNKNIVSDAAITDDETDILDKVKAILTNRKFDTDVVMNFDIDEGTMNIIEETALKENITVDDFLLKAIKNMIEREKL